MNPINASYVRSADRVGPEPQPLAASRVLLFFLSDDLFFFFLRPVRDFLRLLFGLLCAFAVGAAVMFFATMTERAMAVALAVTSLVSLGKGLYDSRTAADPDSAAGTGWIAFGVIGIMLLIIILAV